MNATKATKRGQLQSPLPGLGLLRGFAALAVVPALAMSVGLAAPASAAGSGPTTTLVQPRKVFTDTGITVKAGDSVSIKATGRMHFGGGRIDSLEPVGIPWGAACNAVKQGHARTSPWPSPGNSCWSLIGRIGTGPTFEVGLDKTIDVGRAGSLFLGVNDNFVADNSGQWTATVDVIAAAGTATTTPATSLPAKKSSKSSSAIFVIIGALVVVALLAAFLLAGRRRRKPVATDPEPEPMPVAVAAAEAPASMFSPVPPIAAAAAPMVATIERPADAPPETDSIDVNIFEVEISNGLMLRVGYNHFPDGTALNWRISQSRTVAAVGSFVAKGGGSTNHVETVPIGVKLEGRDAHPDGADVQFDWTINGVPFRYSVRRDPNC